LARRCKIGFSDTDFGVALTCLVQGRLPGWNGQFAATARGAIDAGPDGMPDA
jgi:hypothetical protein